MIQFKHIQQRKELTSSLSVERKKYEIKENDYHRKENLLMNENFIDCVYNKK